MSAAKKPRLALDLPSTSQAQPSIENRLVPPRMLHRSLAVKYLKARPIRESDESVRQTPYATNWTLNSRRKPPFGLYSPKYCTKESLKGYVYTGEPEVQRLAETLKQLGEYPKDLLDDDGDNDEAVEHHRSVEEDLRLAERLFDEQAQNNDKLKALGWLADRVSWRQLPLLARHALIQNDVDQSFVTASMKRGELARSLWPHRLDWMDDFDIEPPAGRPLFEDIEDPNHYDIGDAPISCCIFTRHRNGTISRCLREPIKGFHAKLCQKSIRKQFPFFWSRTVVSPAVCEFHFQVIENEKKNTEDNPILERALGKYDRIACVQFDSDAQFEEIAEYISLGLERTRDEQQNAMSASTRIWRLMDPPKSKDPLRKIRVLQPMEERNYEGKSREEIDQMVEEAGRRKKRRLLRARNLNLKARIDVNGFELEDGKKKRPPMKRRLTIEELANQPDDDIGLSYSSNSEEEYLTDIELPDKLSGWLSPTARCQPGPSTPQFNRYWDDDEAKTSAERNKARIYKALQLGFLKEKVPEIKVEPPKKDSKKALISPKPPNKNTVDEETMIAALPALIQKPQKPKTEWDSTDDEADYEERILRTFGVHHDTIPDPKLSFDGCSGATIRRMKKHYNLPNRSGATTKPMLMEGLHEFFTQQPVDFHRVTVDFLKHVKDPRPPLGQVPPAFANQKRDEGPTANAPSTVKAAESASAAKKKKVSAKPEQPKESKVEAVQPKRKPSAAKTSAKPRNDLKRVAENPIDARLQQEQLQKVQQDKIREQLQIELQKRKDQEKRIQIHVEGQNGGDLDVDLKQEEVIEEGVVYPAIDGEFDGEPVNTSLAVPLIPSPNPNFMMPPSSSASAFAPPTTAVYRPVRNGVVYSGGIGINLPNNHIQHRRFSPNPATTASSTAATSSAAALPRPASAHPTYYQPKTFNNIPSAIINSTGSVANNTTVNAAVKPPQSNGQAAPPQDRKPAIQRTAIHATHKS